MTIETNVDADFLNEIRKEVAIKHDHLLSANDPILITVLLHDLVLGKHLERLSKEQGRYQEQFFDSLAKFREEEKKVAGRVVTDATQFVAEQIGKVSADLMQSVRTETMHIDAMKKSGIASDNSKVSICLLISLMLNVALIFFALVRT